MTRYFLLMICLLAGLPCRAQQLTNGSFENKLQQWRAYWFKSEKGDTSNLDATLLKDGKHSFHAVVNGEKSRLSLTSDPLTAEPEQTYRVVFYYYTVPAKLDGAFTFRIQARDANEQHIGYYCKRDLPGTGNLWIKSEIIFTAPSNSATVKLEFNFHGPNSEIWLDQVSFARAFEVKTADFGPIYPDNRPLYGELLRPDTAPDKPRVYPYWSYYVGESYRDTAAIIGVEQSNAGEFKEAGEYHLAPFYHSFYRRHPALTLQYQTPVLYYPLVNVLEQFKKKRPGQSGKPWGNDPEFVKTGLDVIAGNQFDQGLPDDVPRMVFIADEWAGYITNPALAAANPAYLESVREEVKTKYGFGKFDIPESANDSDPFRRIAWMRWNADLSVETLKTIAQALRAKYPSAQILGFDEWAAATPHDWSRLAQFIDLQPGQVLPMESGFRQFAAAYIAKFHADLTGKPAYPYLQFIKYPSSITVDRLYDWNDLLFQGGAEGIFVGAVEWFDRSLGHPKFSDPEKWEAMLNIIRRTQSMPKLKFPENPQMAVHFGSYSLMAKLRNPENQLYPVFSMLGPRCRSWFTITDDFQIERDPAHWDKYQVVVITEEKYISEALQTAIDRLLERGGTLIVLDPEAFSHRIDGTDLADYRRELFGARIEPSNVSSQEITMQDGRKLSNPDSSNWKITVDDPSNVKVLAQFDDKSPALIEHRLKKGRVWLAAFTTANDYTVDSPQWVAQWRLWLQQLNIRLDEPVWRFQIPRDPLTEKIWRKYACVSGNGMQYVRNFPDTSMNAAGTSVTYQYQIPPRQIPDDGTKLINRTKAKELKKDGQSGVFTEKDKVQIGNWVAEFGKDETAANAITYVFDKPYPLRHGRIFFSGTLPACRVETSTDGNNWLLQTELPQTDADRDIRMAEFSLNTAAQHLRLVLAERPAGTILTLVETDFWAEK